MRGIPSYIVESQVVDLPLSYKWSDRAQRTTWCRDNPVLEKLIGKMAYRAKMSLSVAMAEWVMHRLSKHGDTETLFHYIEACRVACVDSRYMTDRARGNRLVDLSAWRGPVKCPMAISVTLLNKAVKRALKAKPMGSYVVYQANLVEHLLPDVKVFREWRNQAIKELIKYSPADKSLPAGSVVPLELLDPRLRVEPGDAALLIDRYLRQVDHKRNPYLRSPEEVIGAGFDDQTPYEHTKR